MEQKTSRQWRQDWGKAIDGLLKFGSDVEFRNLATETADKIAGLIETLEHLPPNSLPRVARVGAQGVFDYLEQPRNRPPAEARQNGDYVPSTFLAGGPGGKAPVDPNSGLPILGREHRMLDNMAFEGGRPPHLDFGKWCRGAATGNWTDAPEEHRALTVAGTSGGLVLPEILGAEIIDLARANVVCIQAGARTIPLSTGKATLPTLTSDVVGAWQAGENVDIATTAPVIGPTQVVTHTLACYIPQISVQLYEDAPDALGSMLKDAFTRSFAVALDGAALKGAGGANTPTGLLNNASVHQTNVSAGQLTGDEISAAIALIKLRNYQPNSVIYDPSGEWELDTKKASTAGSYLGLPTGVARLNHFVTSAADNDAYVGDFSRLVFFIRTPINIEFSRVGDGTAWTGLSVSMRAYLRADVLATHPGAFEVLTNYSGS